jgi:SAM-dependent methyltransferase
MGTKQLFDNYYFSRRGFVNGTTRLHSIIAQNVTTPILEIGCGPQNLTSDFLSSLGELTGVDIDSSASGNPALKRFFEFNGCELPLPSDFCGMCVSNYVLEHVSDARQHFIEVARVLRSGGKYIFRTPNKWHYVAFASRLLPYKSHLYLANRLRSLRDGHDPYPTIYRANSRSQIIRLAKHSGLTVDRLEMIECEPSYGAAHPLLFYPMMMYERLVNLAPLGSGFRANIIAVLSKP